MKQWTVPGKWRAMVAMVVLGLIATVAPGSPRAQATETPPGVWPWGEAGHAFRLPFTVTPGADGGALYADAEVDFTAAMQQAGSFEAFDPDSLIVHEVDSDGTVLASAVPFQFDKGQNYDATTSAHGELVVEVAGPTVLGEARNYLVYFDTQQGGAAGATVADKVVMESGVTDEGLPAISIGTAAGTWWYQTEAGGFSSLVDLDGTDWIGWSRAIGAAGEFRGIPNLVYPAGYFHPGATGHTTTLGADGPLRVSIDTVSPDQRWEVRWEIYPDGAIAEVVRSDGPYWFLYEGAPGGAVEPYSDFWAQSTGATATLDTTFDADLPAEEWVQFGDPQYDRSLLVINHTDDLSPDSYFTLDGQMTVFGFGRSGLDPSLSGTERRFWVGLLETAGTEAVAASADSRMTDPEVHVGIAQNSLPDTTPPVITSTPTATAGQEHLEVSWGTDEFALSELSVGTDPQLGFGTFFGDDPGLSHTIRATGLTCDTLYHWAVESTDASGNTVSSAIEQARTAPCDQGSRVGGELVLYDFVGGSGSTVIDRSARGTGLDLTILDPAMASWGTDGLTVSGTTVRSAGPASKVFAGVGATDEITVEAWVTPSSVTQSGPARLVSIAPDPYGRNVMLGQGGWGSLPSNTFAGRVRTTTNFGLPTFFTNPGTATPSLTHVVLTRDSGGIATLYVNGTDAGSTTWAGSFANWDSGFPLALGNVADGSRPWNGTLCLVAIYDQALTASEVAVNHDAGCAPTPPGNPPVAIGDSFELSEDGTLVVDAETGVLANDSDPEQNPLTAVLIGGPANGELELGSDGSFTYTPTPNFAGVDSFTYQADDGTTRSSTTTVTLTVHPVDDPPVARDDAYTTRPHTVLSVPAASGVLANDTDADQDPLSASLVDDVTNGSLALSGDGAFVYTPDAGFVGVDGFTYQADSGSGPPSTARVIISVAATNDPPTVTTGSVGFAKQVIAEDVDDTHCAEAADLDGDGDMDVIATDYIDDTVFWYDNDGAGGFTSRILDSNLDGAYPCGAADLDMDGDVDVLAAGYLADTYVWYENNGSASFTRRVIDGAADGAHSIVAADIDGDGDMDLLTANQDAGTVTWYQNDGSQGFSLRTIDSTASGAKRAEAGDVDGDGDLDVVTASFFDNTVAWHRNDGSGNFTKVLIDTNTVGAYYVALADVDGDSELDVFTASQLDNNVAWLRNDGSGNFTKHLIDSNAAGARSVVAGDIDGDGDMDAVGNSVDRGTVSWYDNDGAQGFSTKVVDAAAPGAYGVALADFDQNGFLDVLAASRDAKTVSLHMQGRAHTASVDPGGSYSIGPSRLSASDPDSTPAQLVYRLEAAPRYGAVVVDGLALPVGGTFTQDDVDQSRVSYLHGGSSVANDQFELSLTDGSPDRSPIRVFFEVSVTDPSALIAHLQLDEGSGTSAADATGNGHAGTLLGGAVFDADTPDGSTSAVRFDGIDDSIGLAPVDVDGSGLTVATWFKPSSFGVSDARLVSKATGTAANDHVFMLSTFRSGAVTVLRARVRVDGRTTTLIAPVGALVIGQWQHGALTHDGSVLRLYLNGIEVASTALGGPVDLAPAIGVGIGNQPAGAGSRPFHGLIDDVRIYRQPLSPDELNAIASTLP